MPPQGTLITIEQHIIETQRKDHPTASGRFSWLLSGITLATKIIEAQVRRAGLLDILGSTGSSNIQGEIVQKLDRIANDTILRCLGYRGNVGIMVSEPSSTVAAPAGPMSSLSAGILASKMSRPRGNRSSGGTCSPSLTTGAGGAGSF